MGQDDLAHLIGVDRGVVLGRHHDGGGADRLAVLVLKADLRLGVGAEQRSGAGMAGFGEALGDAGEKWIGAGISASVSRQA